MFSSPIPRPHYSSHPPPHSVLKTIILIQYLIHPQREIIFLPTLPSDRGRSECRVSWIWEGCSNLFKDTNNSRVRFCGQCCVLIGMKQWFMLPGKSKHPQAVAGLSAHSKALCNLSLSPAELHTHTAPHPPRAPYITINTISFQIHVGLISKRCVFFSNCTHVAFLTLSRYPGFISF